MLIGNLEQAPYRTVDGIDPRDDKQDAELSPCPDLFAGSRSVPDAEEDQANGQTVLYASIARIAWVGSSSGRRPAS
jgi:hypothetical protein